MPGNYENLLVKWAEGKERNLARSKNVTRSWAMLKKMLKDVHVTPERRKDFDKMSKEEQDKLKAANGWISGAQCKDNHRNLKNILPRNLMTIDIDYAPETLLEDIEQCYIGCGIYEAVYHSSRRHTPENPRVRIFVPMKRDVTVDEYTALVRFMGYKIDKTMQMVDQVSYRPAQMMFKPTCSKDDRPDFFFYEQHGKLLDPDEMLAEYEAKFGDWRDLATLPKHPDEHLRKKADKAEDPREKAGPVGVFCRIYSIEAAMEKFIPGVYIPGDYHSGNPRFTYAGSTSSNGAVVYDDGLFLYSHHGHDPLCDMNVNAWDMVRIHKFGDEDAKLKGDDDVPMAKRPSFKAMMDFVRTDAEFVRQQASEKYAFTERFSDIEEDEDDETAPRPKPAPDEDDEATDTESAADPFAAFSDIPVDDGEDDPVSSDPGSRDPDGVSPEDGGAADRAHDAEHGRDSGDDGLGDGAGESIRVRRYRGPRPKPSEPRQKVEDWFPGELELNQNGEIISTLHNVAVIIQNDNRLFGRIWFNDFSKQIVARRNIKPHVATVPPFVCRDKRNGDRWQDFNDVSIRALLEAPNTNGRNGYGMKVSERDLAGGISLAARLNEFHPIRDWLAGLRWDGKPRLDTYLIRYLGCDDTPYHRETGALMLIASVARIFEPGHKFDYALILQGEQGTRKSSFIRTLYSEDWFGELDVDLGDKQKTAEQLAGKWGIELPELGALNKTGHNEAKAFMRRQADDVRMAYDRRVTEFPRQCVCWGSTNDDVFLKDPTGNRSYWPVKVSVDLIDTTRLEAEREQLWAEAVERYLILREDHPTGMLPLTLSRKAIGEAEEQQEAVRGEEIYEQWTRQMLDFLDTPVSLQEWRLENGVGGGDVFEDDEDAATTMVIRCAYVERILIEKVLKKIGGQITDAASAVHMNKVRALIEKAGWSAPKKPGEKGAARSTVSGVSNRWRFRKDASRLERDQGYRIVTHESDEDFDVI